MKAIIVKAKPYSFTDSKTGNKLEGTSVQYFTKTPDGEFLIGKTTASYEDVSKFKEIPGVYELEFDYLPNAKGQLVGHFRSAKYIEKAVINI